MKKLYRERDLEIWKARKSGEVLARIGERYGIGRERVRTIVSKIDREEFRKEWIAKILGEQNE